jgi:transposase
MVGRHISDELKAMALSMSLQGIPDLEIHKLTGISTRSLKQLRSTHRRTGEVSCKPLVPGQPCNLMSMQVNFLCNCVKWQPNMTLMELQTELRDICGVEMSVTMVMRSLHWEGFTTKTMRPFLFLLSQLAHQLL